MSRIVVGGMAVLALLAAGRPAAAQVEFNDGGRSAYFFPEEWDGNELTGEGWVYVIDWTTGADGWSSFQFNGETGEVQVWDEGVGESPERPSRYYGGVACHDHPAQNERFGKVVIKAFSSMGPGLVAMAWRCIGQGPGCLVENIAIGTASPILWDIGWYAWTCYRP